MKKQDKTRSSGVLMHITSLPGKYGIGTLGKEAYEFVDLLAEGGQKYWQILPFNPVSSVFGYSPYSPISSFAGNYFFIDPDMLHEEKWIKSDITSYISRDENGDYVDFEKVEAAKQPLLKTAALDFFKYAEKPLLQEFDRFCKKENHWLEDYCLYVSLAEHFKDYNWLEWEEGCRMREPSTVKTWSQKLEPSIRFHRFVQFIFFKQWALLKAYANKKGIHIIGDIPIYVNLDSSEAWANPGIFQLDAGTLRPKKVAGVPPDYFSPTGQRWGNPLYTWFENGQLKEETVQWWIARLKHLFKFVDLTRLDHFRGFESYWAIPAKEPTAIKGKWEKGPGLALFLRLKDELGELPIIAEDLGVITPKVELLRDQLGFPGMKILQFAFDFDPKNSYLPHNYTNSNCIVYTGTHDNDTTNGWFYEQGIDEKTRQYVMEYMHLNHIHEFHWQFITLALSSIAGLSIFPVQDLLGYAGQFRMNTPGKSHDNWRWKLVPNRLTPGTMHRLKNLCELYNRLS